MSECSRTFSLDDQTGFAEWSGDRHPRHLDPVWSASRFPGQLVAHGLHVLLWGLDRCLPASSDRRLSGLRASFVRPVLVGDPVTATLAEHGSLLTLLVRGEPAVVARLTFGSGAAAVQAHADWIGEPAPWEPAEPIDLAGLTGRVARPTAARALVERFPRLHANVGAAAVAEIAVLSQLVGMHCPGLCGVLAEVDVTLESASPAVAMSFSVRQYSPGFRCAVMDVHGASLHGRVTALVERTYEPPSDEAIRQAVRPHEFAGARPLVVGASDGLGAVTARLLVAGGAAPVLTWHFDERRLDDVRRSVAALGGRAESLHLDVTQPGDALAELSARGWSGRQLYYFATPRIFRRRLGLFRPDDFRAFCDIYVEGFLNLVEGLLSARPEVPLHCFYPSSTAVDEPTAELLEYAMAKSAGERLCAALTTQYAPLDITVKRLPRTRTRQTAAFLNVAAVSPETVMPPILRSVQEGCA